MFDMAIFHFTVNSGSKGKGAVHCNYILRVGQYEAKTDLAYSHSKLPDWAESPDEFWGAADKFERKNGSVYREFEFALPRELALKQNIDFVKDWINKVLPKQFYSFAIHNPNASDGELNMHCHLMICERKNDGIDRPAEQFFSRYNTKNPKNGGAKKLNTGISGKQRKQDMMELREEFALLQNDHLERAGSTARVDHRTLKKQGVNRVPQAHIGHSAWSLLKAGKPSKRMQMMENRRRTTFALRNSLLRDARRKIKEYEDALISIGDTLEKPSGLFSFLLNSDYEKALSICNSKKTDLTKKLKIAQSKHEELNRQFIAQANLQYSTPKVPVTAIINMNLTIIQQTKIAEKVDFELSKKEEKLIIQNTIINDTNEFVNF